MSTENIEFGIPLDEDGFVELQCPFCNELFKLSYEELNADDVIDLFCPSCGLTDSPKSFLTKELIESINIMMANRFKEMINKNLKKVKNNSKAIKITTKEFKLETEKKLFVKNNNVDLVEFECCSKYAKVSNLVRENEAFCPYCGVKK